MEQCGRGQHSQSVFWHRAQRLDHDTPVGESRHTNGRRIERCIFQLLDRFRHNARTLLWQQWVWVPEGEERVSATVKGAQRRAHAILMPVLVLVQVGEDDHVIVAQARDASWRRHSMHVHLGMDGLRQLLYLEDALGPPSADLVSQEEQEPSRCLALILGQGQKPVL